MQYDHLTLFPTMKCNLKCFNCANKGTKAATAKDWSLDELISIARMIKEFGFHFKTITFGGGEPTLWPYFLYATSYVKAHNLCDKVQVLTNGIVKDPNVYGTTDVVRVTDYGAVNRYYFRELRKHLGRRLHICPSVHVPLPMPYTEKVSCSLFHLAVLNGKVYKCCTQAKHDIDGCDINDNVLEYLQGPAPDKSELCHTCYGNKHAYEKVAAPLTIQGQIWGVEEASVLMQFPFNMKALRTLYQKLRSRRGR